MVDPVGYMAGVKPFDATALSQQYQNLLNSQKQGYGLDIANDTNQTALMVQKLGNMKQLLNEHLNDKNVTQADLYQSIDDGVKNGSYTLQQAAIAKGNIGRLPDNPGALHQYLAGQNLSIMNAHQALVDSAPTEGPIIDTGSALQPTLRGSLAGASPNALQYNGPPLPKQLTPGDAATIGDVRDPNDGTTIQLSKGDAQLWAQNGYKKDSLGQPILTPYGGGPVPLPPQPGQPQPVQPPTSGGPRPSQTSLLGRVPTATTGGGPLSAPIPPGMLPPGALGPNPDVVPPAGGTGGLPPPPPIIGKPTGGPAPTTAPPPPTTTAPATGGSTAPPPITDNRIPTQQMMDAQAKNRQLQQDEVSYYSTGNPSFANANRNLSTIINMAGTGGAVTGLGTANAQTAAQVLSNVAPGLAKSLGIDPETVAGRAELLKNMHQYALNSGSGGGTDANLIAKQLSSPNEEMPPATAQAVARTLLGMNRYQQAVALAANDKVGGNGGNAKDISTQYPQVKAAISNATDPMAFMPMNSDDLRAYIKRSFGPLDSSGKPLTAAGMAGFTKFKNSVALRDKYGSDENTGAVMPSK